MSEYQEKSKYNLTKLIELSYKTQNEVLKKSLENIDFSEKSKLLVRVELQSYNEQTEKYDNHGLRDNLIEESLALNCIRLLPLQSYEQYIKPEWIFIDNNQNFTLCHAALGNDKFDFLDKLFTMTTEKFNNAAAKEKNFSSYANQYSKSVLDSLLNIGKFLRDQNVSHYGLNENSYQQFYTLFKKAINHYPSYRLKHMQSQYVDPKFIDKKEDINDLNWFLNFNKVTQMYYNFEKKESILQYVVKDSKAFEIYIDIYNQLETTLDNPLKNIKVLEEAIVNGNNAVVDHLVQQLNINTVELTNLINQNFIKEYENFSKEYNKNKDTTMFNYAYKNHVATMESLFKIIEKNTNYDINSNNYISAIGLLKANEIKDFINQYPKLKKDLSVQGCTINEWVKAENIFTEFIEKHGLELEDKFNKQKVTEAEVKKSTYDLLLVSKLKKHIKYTEPSIDRKFAIQDLVANNYLSLIKGLKSDKEKYSLFNMFILENTVPNKEESVKTTKLKI